MSSISTLSELFDAVVDMPPPERGAYLERACGGDAALREAVERLVAKHSGETTGVLAWTPREGGAASGGEGVWEAPPTRIGPYRIIGVLGEGGMGRVYEAEQQSPKRSIALKVIGRGFDSGLVSAEGQRRFAREAQTLAALQHVGIAQVYESGEAADDRGTVRRFIAMELIRGSPLLEHATGAKLSIEERVELLARVADAVQHAHQRGVIHRDLKPANILVVAGGSDGQERDAPETRAGGGGPRTAGTTGTSRGVTAGSSTGRGSTGRGTGLSGIGGIGAADHIGQPKVLDFGVARLIGDGSAGGGNGAGGGAGNGAGIGATAMTEAGRIIGTVAYMSPEQISGDSAQVDTRTDVYVLGVLGYELLCGVPPLDVHDKGLAQAARLVVEHEPVPLGQRCRECRGELETMIAKAMEKQRDRRYAGAGEFGADLRRYLRHEPILARPPTTVYQLRKLAQRNRALVVGSSLAVTALVVGLAVSLVALGRAERQRALAQEASVRHGQVARVLKDVFGGINPESAKGRDVSVLRETLERAESRLGAELADQPGTEAELRTVLGDAYRNLSKPERAEALYRQAIVLCERAGDAGAAALPALNNRLSLLLLDQSRLAEAAAAAERARELLREAGSSDADELVTNLLRFAEVRRAEGKLAEGEALYRDALAKAGAAHGERSAQYSAVLASLANVVDDLGRYGEAEGMLSSAIEISTASQGELHPETVEMIDNLSGLYYRQRKLPQAEATARRALELNRRLVPGDSAATASSLTRVSNALADQGKLAEATELQGAALEMNRRVWGPESKNVASGYANLGNLFADSNQPERALEMISRALEMDRRLFPTPSRQVFSDVMLMARVLQRTGRFAQIGPYGGEMISLARALLPAEHPRRQDAEVNGAYFLLEAAWAMRSTPGEAAELERQGRTVMEEVAPGIVAREGEKSPIALRAAQALALADVLRAARLAAASGAGGAAETGVGTGTGTGAGIRTDIEAALRQAAERCATMRELAFAEDLAMPEMYRVAFRQGACLQLARLHEVWDAAVPGAGHGAEAAVWRERGAAVAEGAPGER